MIESYAEALVSVLDATCPEHQHRCLLPLQRRPLGLECPKGRCRAVLRSFYCPLQEANGTLWLMVLEERLTATRKPLGESLSKRQMCGCTSF